MPCGGGNLPKATRIIRATSAFERVEGDAGTQPADGLEVVAGEVDLGAVEAQRHHEIVAAHP